MPWAGAALASLLWGGIAAWLVATLGIDELLTQPPLVLAGGVRRPALDRACPDLRRHHGPRRRPLGGSQPGRADLRAPAAGAGGSDREGDLATLAEALSDTRSAARRTETRHRSQRDRRPEGRRDRARRPRSARPQDELGAPKPDAARRKPAQPVRSPRQVDPAPRPDDVRSRPRRAGPGPPGRRHARPAPARPAGNRRPPRLAHRPARHHGRRKPQAGAEPRRSADAPRRTAGAVDPHGRSRHQGRRTRQPPPPSRPPKACATPSPTRSAPR